MRRQPTDSLNTAELRSAVSMLSRSYGLGSHELVETALVRRGVLLLLQKY